MESTVIQHIQRNLFCVGNTCRQAEPLAKVSRLRISESVLELKAPACCNSFSREIKKEYLILIHDDHSRITHDSPFHLYRQLRDNFEWLNWTVMLLEWSTFHLFNILFVILIFVKDLFWFKATVSVQWSTKMQDAKMCFQRHNFYIFIICTEWYESTGWNLQKQIWPLWKIYLSFDFSLRISIKNVFTVASILLRRNYTQVLLHFEYTNA